MRIGLFGPWGSGKSSILSILENEELSDTNYKIVRFNPWIYSSEDDLINGFNTEVFFNFKVSSKKINTDWIKKGADAVGSLLDKANINIEKLGTFGIAASQVGNFLKSVLINKDTIGQIIEACDRRVIFIIEDIDRCNINIIKPFLLYLREVLNQKDVVTIFVSDLSALNKGFDESSNLQGFFEKIYDYPIFIEDMKTGEASEFILKSEECPYPPKILDKYAYLLPNNPRSLKKVCRSFSLLKKEIDRQHPADISLKELFITQTLMLKYPTLSRLFLNEEDLYLHAVRNQYLRSRDNRTEEEKREQLEKSLTDLLDKHASNIATDEEKKSFVKDMMALYISDLFYLGERTFFYARIVSEPVPVTRKEIESFLSKNLSDISVEDIISYQGVKSLSDLETLESLLNFRSQFLEQYYKTFFKSCLGDCLKSILKVTELIHSFLINDRRYTNELFGHAVGNFRQWGSVIRCDSPNNSDDLDAIISLEDRIISDAVETTNDKYGLKKVADSVLENQRLFGDGNPLFEILKTSIVEAISDDVGASFVETLVESPELIGDQDFCSNYRDEITKENLKLIFDGLKAIADPQVQSEKIYIFFEKWLRDKSTFFHFIHNWHEVKEELREDIFDLWSKIDSEHLTRWGDSLRAYMEKNLGSHLPEETADPNQ